MLMHDAVALHDVAHCVVLMYGVMYYAVGVLVLLMMLVVMLLLLWISLATCCAGVVLHRTPWYVLHRIAC